MHKILTPEEYDRIKETLGNRGHREILKLMKAILDELKEATVRTNLMEQSADFRVAEYQGALKLISRLESSLVSIKEK